MQKNYATGYTCNSCLQKGITILFCKQIGRSPSTNYASSFGGFKMDWMEVAGTVLPPIVGLKLPVVKAKVPKQNPHVGKAVSH